jgi:hypothetical protein
LDSEVSTLTVYSDAADGLVYGLNATYTTARSTASVADGTYLFIGQALGYYCGESFLSFITSDVPDDATISAAILSLYVAGEQSVTDFTLEARLRDWGATLTTADWVAGASLSALTLLASKSTVGISGAAYLALTSEAAFATNVNKTGTTLLLLDSSRHVAGTTPTGNEYIDCSSSEYAGTTQDPKLVVTYTALPTVTTAAISAITASGATGGGEVTVAADGVTDSGICWNTAGTPTIADSHVHHASPAVEAFAENLASLSPGTTYHVRAFAVNAAGTSYGSEVDFLHYAPGAYRSKIYAQGVMVDG